MAHPLPHPEIILIIICYLSCRQRKQEQCGTLGEGRYNLLQACWNTRIFTLRSLFHVNVKTWKRIAAIITIHTYFRFAVGKKPLNFQVVFIAVSIRVRVTNEFAKMARNSPYSVALLKISDWFASREIGFPILVGDELKRSRGTWGNHIYIINVGRVMKSALDNFPRKSSVVANSSTNHNSSAMFNNNNILSTIKWSRDRWKKDDQEIDRQK